MSPQNSSRLAPVMMVIAGLVLMFGSILWIAVGSKPQPTQPVFSTPATLAQPMGALPTMAENRIPHPEIERVSLEDAKAAYDSRKAIFLDVRGDQYYQTGHVAGAVSISVAELPNRLGELDKNAWIIPYCTWPAEESSARAAIILNEAGFTQVTPLLGGFEAWLNAGYPVEP